MGGPVPTDGPSLGLPEETVEAQERWQPHHRAEEEQQRQAWFVRCQGLVADTDHTRDKQHAIADRLGQTTSDRCHPGSSIVGRSPLSQSYAFEMAVDMADNLFVYSGSAAHFTANSPTVVAIPRGGVRPCPRISLMRRCWAGVPWPAGNL